MKEVKKYDSERKNFRAWLLEAELSMEPSWSYETRIGCLMSRLDLPGIAKLERVLQHMEENAIPRG